jgi:SpoVK/Ycf46/Vps4 family AAA+-type ATPase
MREKQYVNLVSNGKGFYIPNESDNKVLKKLPPGVYTLEETSQGQIFFKSASFLSDDIVDLPSKAYLDTVEEIQRFLKPETKKLFKDWGFVYKRSSLLWGVPGTGKTCIVNQISKRVIEMGGVVLFNPDPRILKSGYEIFDDLQPDSLIMVVFEELEKLIDRYESHLLNILDGETQKDNIVYLATTNFIDKIPERIKRPGRFSAITEVTVPDAACREHFLKVKGVKDSLQLEKLVKITNGYTVDELKEVLLATMCLDISLKEITSRISKNKTPKGELFDDEGYDDYPDHDDFAFPSEAKRKEEAIINTIAGKISNNKR